MLCGIEWLFMYGKALLMIHKVNNLFGLNDFRVK